MNCVNNTKAEKLMVALKAKDCASSKVLVTSVRSVNYTDKIGGSLLMYSSVAGCTDVVKKLLDKGANVNLKAVNGTTALLASSEMGNKG
jgi:ankyrin repeat protein